MPYSPDRREFLASVAACVGVSAYASGRPSPALELWYRQPAERWVEALPVGNGRLGAMVFGGITNERIQFNEDTVWQGEPHSYANSGAHRWLGRIRNHLFQGRQQEAETLAMERFMSIPLRQKAYQSFGDLLIERHGVAEDEVTDYRRSLDIEEAVARVQFVAGNTTYTQEVFASYPMQVLVVRLAASGASPLSFTTTLRTSHPLEANGEEGGMLRMAGRIEGGAIRVEAALAVKTDGSVSIDGGQVRV